MLRFSSWNRYKKFCFLQIFIIFSFNLFSQGIAVGSWRYHLPFNNVIGVANTSNLFWACNSYYLYSYDVTTSEINIYSKLNKLSDININAYTFDKAHSIMILGYQNGNIDIFNYKNLTTRNVPDIYLKSMMGSKSINNIYVKDNFIYFSCDFGIAVYDLNKNEFKNTYYLSQYLQNKKVKASFIYNDYLYSLFDTIIISAPLNGSNLNDFTNWNTFLATNSEIIYTNVLNNNLYAVIDSGWNDLIIKYNVDHWDTIIDTLNFNINKVIYDNNEFIILADGAVFIYDNFWNLKYKIYKYFPNDNVPYPQDAIYSADKKYLIIGDKNVGLAYNWNDTWNNRIVTPSGPSSDQCFKVSYSNETILSTAGGYDMSFGNLWNQINVEIFRNENWSSYNSDKFPELSNARDGIKALIDPFNANRLFIATYGYGLIEINNNIVKIFNDTNSILPSTSGITGFCRISDIQFDAAGNLWILVAGANEFTVYKTNGQMVRLPISSSISNNNPGEMVIDENNNNVYVPFPRGSGGVLVFKYNGTIDNTSDDRSMILTTQAGNGKLPSNIVYSLAIDKNDQLWLATSEGVAVIYNTQNFFTANSFDASQIILEVDGYAMPMLISEKVNKIEIDGANRKWFATDNAGIFTFSSNGDKEVYHFTNENSPLLSNKVISMTINPITGEVFAATDLGLVSYRSNATEPFTEMQEIKIFPNPVPADINGYITIDGLPEDSYVTITDSYGKVVYKTKSLGGRATWNGVDVYNNKAQRGVYIVWVSNDDGSIKGTGKFFIE